MSTDHTQQLWQASQLGKYGDYEAAHELIVQVLKEDPSNITAWWGIANYSKSPLDRRKALLSILHLQPDHEPAQNMLTRLDEQFPPEDQSIEFEERSFEFPVPKVAPPPPPLHNTSAQQSAAPWVTPQMPNSNPRPQQQARYAQPKTNPNPPWNSDPSPTQQPSKPKRKTMILGAVLIIIPAILLSIAGSGKWSILSTGDILVLYATFLFGTGAAIHIGQSIRNIAVQQAVHNNPTAIVNRGSPNLQWITTIGAIALLGASIAVGILFINKYEAEAQNSGIVGVWRGASSVLGAEVLDFRPNGKLYATSPLGRVNELDYYLSGDQLAWIDNAGTESESVRYFTVRDLDSSSLVIYSEQRGLYTFVRVR